MSDHIVIGDLTPRVQYAADGEQAAFTYPFPIFEAGDLEVYLDDQLQAAGYAVAGAGADAGGTVTFVSPPADGVRVTLRRRLAIKRTTDFQEGGAFRAATLNDELDYQAAALQQVDAELARALRLDPADPDVATLLPGRDVRKGMFLAFSAADGTPIAAAGPVGDDAVPVSVPFGTSLVSAADAAAGRETLGLGSAATRAVGTGDGDVPAFDAGGYPAADGSRITNLTGANIAVPPMPRGYIDGLILANAAGDAAHDVTVGPGACRDAGNAGDVVLASALTKRADAAWAVGSGNGGGFVAMPSDGTLHVFLITRDADGTVDAGFDTDASGADAPDGWTVRRRVGSVLVAGSAILPFRQWRDRFVLRQPPLSVDTSSLGTTPQSVGLDVPTGIEVVAIVNLVLTIPSVAAAIYLYPTVVDDAAPSLTAAPLATARRGGGVTSDQGGPIEILTDTGGLVRAVSTVASTTLRIATLGWIDGRGRDA